MTEELDQPGQRLLTAIEKRMESWVKTNK